jgi:hypothetical protein
VVAPPAAAPAVLARRLAARAKQRGTVLIATRDWPTAELTIEADHGTWYGLAAGRGRLRWRTMTVVVRGRGAAERLRHAQMWLPPLTGPLPMVSGQVVGVAQPIKPAEVSFPVTA